MKAPKVSKFLLLVIILFIGCYTIKYITADNHKDIINMDSLADINKLEDEMPISSTVCDNETTIQNIDYRVLWVNENLEEFNCQESKVYTKDCYDGNILIYRRFSHDFDDESYSPTAGYILYYSEYGNLVYADITHYRGALYSIYFQDDKLLYTKVGPFIKGRPFIDGDLAQVQEVIKEDTTYDFVLEDINICLEYAYK